MSIKQIFSIPLSLLFAGTLVVGTVSQAQAAKSCTSLYEKQDYTAALQQCEFEAEHHALSANFMLGQMYINGQGVPQNTSKGIAYYRQAVLNNDVDSQIALGKYHAANHNYLQSHVFFSLAIDSGSLVLNLKDKAASKLSAKELELSKGYLSLVKAAIAQQRKQLAGN